VRDVSIEPGVLYVVATPIGNLDDISHRAVKCLQAVSLVAAEDTRRTRQLLSHLGIARPLVSVHEHNERSRIDGLISQLRAGCSIALVSDAGTPLVSDPGYPLVRALAGQGIRIIPIPGACSIIAALCAAGLPTDRFLFDGFLPARAAARRQHLLELARQSRTIALLESARRIRATLADMEAILGPEREAVLARELTKLHEEFLRGSIHELGALLDSDPGRCRGEFVIIVRGADASAVEGDDVAALMDALLAELPVSRAAALAARVTGRRRAELYRLGLQLAKGQS
jgi:16S rRNA (cytidine1402-2'-O)-methyltransferase